MHEDLPRHLFTLGNAELIKLCPKLYQSRYNPSAIKVNQDTIHRLQSCELSSISVAVQQAITQAINATQGHTHSYQKSYYLYIHVLQWVGGDQNSEFRGNALFLREKGPRGGIRIYCYCIFHIDQKAKNHIYSL